jgi:hypothetical protein
MNWSLTFYDAPTLEQTRSQFSEHWSYPYFDQSDYLMGRQIERDREGLQGVMAHFISLLPEDEVPEQLRESRQRHLNQFA